MPGTINVHNKSAANITVTVSNPSGAHSSGKCSEGKVVTLDLSKMSGWNAGDPISLSVHADGGVTRHNTSGTYDQTKDYRYNVQGTPDAFSVEGPE